MLSVNYSGHTAYQNTFVSEFLKLFPDPFAVPKQTWDIIVKFWYLDLSEADTITQWCRQLKITPLYAILSGFSVDDTPGVGTFYDFFNWLWQSDKDNYVRQIKHKKPKPESCCRF